MTLSKGRCVRDPLRQHRIEDEPTVRAIRFETGDRTQEERYHPTIQARELHGVGKDRLGIFVAGAAGEEPEKGEPFYAGARSP